MARERGAGVCPGVGTKLEKGLEHREQQRELGRLSMQERKLRGYLLAHILGIGACNYYELMNIKGNCLFLSPVKTVNVFKALNVKLTVIVAFLFEAYCWVSRTFSTSLVSLCDNFHVVLAKHTSAPLIGFQPVLSGSMSEMNSWQRINYEHISSAGLCGDKEYSKSWIKFWTVCEIYLPATLVQQEKPVFCAQCEKPILLEHQILCLHVPFGMF